jgi:hypothetical protein
MPAPFLSGNEAAIVRRYIDTLASVGVIVPPAVHLAAVRLSPTVEELEDWDRLIAAGCTYTKQEEWPVK